MIGIYQIHNVRMDTKYIGSSPSFGNHFRRHLYQLASGTHPNERLQSDWNMYGSESFEFSLLEVLNSKYLLNEREGYWVRKADGKHIGAEVQYAHKYAESGVGRLTVSSEIKSQLKALEAGTMDQATNKLMDFYLQHSKCNLSKK